MSTTVQLEKASDIIEEIKPLLQLHWREVAHYEDIPLDPDYDTYRRSTALRVFTARKDTALVGYAVFAVGRHQHYRTCLQAVQDIVFVDPRDRGGVGRQLVRAAEEQFRKEGVQVVYQHQKIAHPALGELLRSEGYEPIEVLWAKRLDKE